MRSRVWSVLLLGEEAADVSKLQGLSAVRGAQGGQQQQGAGALPEMDPEDARVVDADVKRTR